MKRIVALLLVTTFAFAQDVVTEYRMHGLEGIEKKLDLELTKKTYWDQQLKMISTDYGYFETKMDLLTCNKKDSYLELHVMDKNNSFHTINDFSAFTGKNSGDKVSEGDARTPIGIYNITQKLDKVDSFYGPLALVTSYPNLYDRYNNKDGHGIWIHGLPLNQQRNDYTKGCIVIGNNDIVCLDKKLDYANTLLIINDTKVKADPSKDVLASILANLYMWRYTWIYNDLKTYLNFYDASFKRFDGMEIKAFEAYKTRIFAKNESKTIRFSNLRVIPYPDYEKDLYEISFDEDYKSHSFVYSGKKKLIVKIDANQMKIITEE